MDNAVCKIELDAEIGIMSLVLDTIQWKDSEELNSAFTTLLYSGNKKIILDLSQTQYVSSLVLATFTVMLKRAKEVNASLIICGLQHKVKEVFAMTNLDKVFYIVPSRQDAINRLLGK